MKYDVIVVGGGPGGAIAGKVAAENGLKTIVFERGRVPGEKNASGVGLTPKIWRDFPNIMKEMDLPSTRTARMCVAHLCDETGEIVSEFSWTPSKLNTYKEAREFMVKMVYRSQFDKWLATYTTSAGAELKTSTLIIDVLRDDAGKIIGVVDEKGEKYEGIVIGADGAVSTIANKSGLRAKFGPFQTTTLVNYDFSAPPEKIDEVIGDAALQTWFSPLYPGVYNFFKKDGFHIGLGQWFGKVDKSPRAYLEACIKSPPVQRLIKRLNAKPREFHAHQLPWLQYPMRTYGHNVMLIGDAAGFPCPLEAEGIWHAMYSGRLAALNAKEAIENSDVSINQMKKYEDAWVDSPLGEEFSAGKEFQEFWSGLPFNTEKIGEFNDLMNDVFNLFTGSVSHLEMSQLLFKKLRNDGPDLLPLFRQYLFPYLGRIVEEEIKDMSPLTEMLDKMKPKRKHRRRN